MKRKLSTLLILTIIVLSCGDREHMLQTLEALEQQNRDYVPFTSDSTALALTDYFDSHGTANERMRAHYILGCAYRDMGEAPRALECYNDAVECADTTAADCDYKTLSRIYGQMGNLFSQITAPELEIQQCRLAGKYALLAKDTLAFINYYELQYGGYWVLGLSDSILHVCDVARSMYVAIGQKENAAITRAMAADVYISRKDFPNARKNIQIYEKESGLFDSEGNIAHGHEMYYDIKGRLLLGEKNLDSAKMMFMKLLTFKDDINCQEAAYKGLLNVYESMSVADSTKKYSRLYAETNDSSNIIKSSAEMVEIQAMYNYGRMQHAVYQKEKEKNKYRLALIMLIMAILLTAYIAYRIIQKKKQQYKEELEINNMEYSETLKKYNDTVHLLNQAMITNNEYKEKIEEERIKYEKILSKYIPEEELFKSYKADEKMLNSEIIKRFHQMAAHGKKPSMHEWVFFSKTFENRMVDFKRHIESPKYRLSEREKIVCMLIRLSFISSEIIILMDINAQKMTNIRTSINEKMFGIRSAKGIEKNIKRLFPLA